MSVPIVETTIEAKHKAVAMESIRGMGPVRVSLSNRLPLLERHVRDDPRYLLRLVECFEEARHFKQIPMLLGLADHPSLQHLRRMRSSDLVQVLTRIIYRCDLYDVFHDKAEFARQHEIQQNNANRKAAKLVAKEKVVVSEGHVWRDAMLQHIRAVFMPDCFYATSRSTMTMERLSHYLGQSETMAAKRRRLADDGAGDLVLDVDGLMPDGHADAEAAAALAHDRCYFKIRHITPGDRKVARVAVGAGRSLQSTQFAITMHECFPGEIDVVQGGHRCRVVSDRLAPRRRGPPPQPTRCRCRAPHAACGVAKGQ